MLTKKITLFVGLALGLVTLVFPIVSLAKPAAPVFVVPPDFSPAASAAELPDTYARGTIVKILDAGTEDLDGQSQEYQILEIEIVDGAEQGKHITIDNGRGYVVGIFQKFSVGDAVVVAKPASTPGARKDLYYITDRYRTNNLIVVALIFFALAIYFGRRRGFTAIIGMLFSILVIFGFIIPNIVHGADPLLICVIGAIIIILLSLYLSHGFNRRTTVALVSTLLTLGIAIALDLFFVHLAGLRGTGTEEAFYLQFDTFKINLEGLLLGGILIGVLGVLDDVTTGQTAAVEEIAAASDQTLGLSELYKRGLSVGREHIASLINTLVLAYVGASFPLLLLYSTQRLQPLWVILNSNFIAEEIVRTLVGSATLVIAVPLTTLLAAWVYSRRSFSAALPSTPSATREEALIQWWTNKP